MWPLTVGGDACTIATEPLSVDLGLEWTDASAIWGAACLAVRGGSGAGRGLVAHGRRLWCPGTARGPSGSLVCSPARGLYAHDHETDQSSDPTRTSAPPRPPLTTTTTTAPRSRSAIDEASILYGSVTYMNIAAHSMTICSCDGAIGRGSPPNGDSSFIRMRARQHAPVRRTRRGRCIYVRVCSILCAMAGAWRRATRSGDACRARIECAR